MNQSISIFAIIKKLQKIISKDDKKKLFIISGFVLCSSFFEILTAGFVVIFAQVINNPEVSLKYLTFLGIEDSIPRERLILYTGIAFGVVYLIKNIISVCETFYQNFSIQRMNYLFKQKMLRRYAQADYSYYLTRNSSLGIEVLRRDIEEMFSSGMNSLASLISEGFVFLCLSIMIISMDISLSFIICGLGIIFGYVISKKLLPFLYLLSKNLQEASLLCNQNLLQFFHGFKEIILRGKKDFFVETYEIYSLKQSRSKALQVATNSTPRIALEVVFVGLFVTAISVLCLENESPTKIMGILGGYMYVGFRLMPSLNRIITYLGTFKQSIPSIERVWEEYHTPALSESYVSVEEFKFEKSINLRNINFIYPNTTRKVLNDVFLTIEKGECIGLIGETGSGKSTLIDIILGLLRPIEGAILVDGEYSVNSPQWHQFIGYVPQSIYLVDDTIEANIVFGEKPENIDFDRLNKAIDSAQLRKFINQLPHQEKTMVGEGGVRLSGGERQRISIARALYRNPQVLIFDEATSALDNETEAQLMDTINIVGKGRTVIMVAHRLTTLKSCNRIIMMDKGCIQDTLQYEDLEKREKLKI
jgi:ATP-binding cassette subfamily C protein